MGTTTHMGWDYPAFRTRPWFDEFVLMLGEIDDTAFDHETRIIALESGITEIPESSISPDRDDLSGSQDLTDWKGKTFTNNGAGAIVTWTIDDTDMEIGARCRIIQTNKIRAIKIRVVTTAVLLLPDGVEINSTGAGILTGTPLTEIELLCEEDHDRGRYIRVLVNQGSVQDLDSSITYYKGTDYDPDSVSSNEVIPSNDSLTSTQSLTDWQGMYYDNYGALADITLTLDISGIENGAVAVFRQIDPTYKMLIKPGTGILLELPDGVILGDTSTGFRSDAQYSEIEILKFTNASGVARLRAYVKHGQWYDTTNLKTYGAPNHNDAIDLQGGAANDRYHLTLAQHSRVRYKREIERITSVDDTTTTLTTSNSDEIVVVGSGILFNLNLGDATTYPDDNLDTKKFTIHNSTPEFVGVYNSDNTVWRRVPPRATCVCVLLNNSTAAGVWWSAVDDPDDENSGFNYRNEFGSYFVAASGVHYDGGLPLVNTGAGTGIRATVTQDPSNGFIGGTSMESGTDVNSWDLWYYRAQIPLGYGAFRAYATNKLSELSTAAQEYIFRFGLTDNIVGGAPTNGSYILYDRATDGDFYACKNITGAGSAKTVSAVAPNVSSAQLLSMEVSSGRSRCDFWVGKTLISPAGGIATYIPASAVCYPLIGITKTAGNIERTSNVGVFGIRLTPTTLR